MKYYQLIFFILLICNLSVAYGQSDQLPGSATSTQQQGYLVNATDTIKRQNWLYYGNGKADRIVRYPELLRTLIVNKDYARRYADSVTSSYTYVYATKKERQKGDSLLHKSIDSLNMRAANIYSTMQDRQTGDASVRKSLDSAIQLTVKLYSAVDQPQTIIGPQIFKGGGVTINREGTPFDPNFYGGSSTVLGVNGNISAFGAIYAKNGVSILNGALTIPNEGVYMGNNSTNGTGYVGPSGITYRYGNSNIAWYYSSQQKNFRFFNGSNSYAITLHTDLDDLYQNTDLYLPLRGGRLLVEEQLANYGSKSQQDVNTVAITGKVDSNRLYKSILPLYRLKNDTVRDDYGLKRVGAIRSVDSNVIAPKSYSTFLYTLNKNAITAEINRATAQEQLINNKLIGSTDKTNQFVLAGYKKSVTDTLNNYEFSMSRLADGTLIRAGVYSIARSEQAAGNFIAFSKSTDEGASWSAPVTIYTATGSNTCELPTIGVVGTRIALLFRITTGGVNTYTNGTAKAAYSNDGGATWVQGNDMISPNGLVLLPYGKILRHSDDQHIALLHNQNYCEAWQTTDGINWTFRKVVYDYRASPVIASSVLIEPSISYIGGGQDIILARNNAPSGNGTTLLQFNGSGNLSNIVYKGVTNLSDGISLATRYYNPAAILTDTAKRLTYVATTTRSYEGIYPDANLYFISDADAVYNSATAYQLKFNTPRQLANGMNYYNKGYNSLVMTSSGILGTYTETTYDWKSSSPFSSKINNSYQYSLINTTTPYDVKSLANIYAGAGAVKNIITGGYDYLTATPDISRDALGNVTFRHNGTYTWFPTRNSGDAIWKVYRQNATTALSFTADAFTLSGAGLYVTAAAGASNGEVLSARLYDPTAVTSTILATVMASGAAQYGLIKQTGGKPLSLGTTAIPNAIYITSDGKIGLNNLSPTAYFHLRPGTAAAGTAPVKFSAGSLNTTPEAYALENDANRMYYTNSGGTRNGIAMLNNESHTGTTSLVHLKGGSAVPAIVAGTGAGATPTLSISGTDLSGTITLTTGSNPAASGIIATVTFNSAYNNAPHPAGNPAAKNAVSASLTGTASPYYTTTNGSLVLNANATALAPNTTYVWDYTLTQ